MKKEQVALQLNWIERQISLTLEGESVLNLTLRRPELTGSGRRHKRINRYFKRFEGLWEKRWRRILYLAACVDLAQCRSHSHIFHPWSATLDGEGLLLPDGQLSIKMEAREVRWEGKPLFVRSCSLWDINEGTPLGHKALGKKTFTRKNMLKLTADAAANAKQLGCFFPDTDYSVALKGCFEPNRFYKTEDGIEVFYPQAVLAPAQEGIPTFRLQA